MNLNRLSELRRDNEFSQKYIADKLHISRSTYASYEINNRIIPLKYLYELSKIYQVSLNYITGLINELKIKNPCLEVTFNKEDIGKRIYEIRQDNHISLRNLATNLNTTGSTIYAYEKGKTLILTAFAIQLCQMYHISLDWLCGISQDKFIFE